MKTFYNKYLFLKVLKLPALIFFLLALSYNVKAQYADPNIVCHGDTIYLFCGSNPACGNPATTYTWTDKYGNIFSHVANPKIAHGDPAYESLEYYYAFQLGPDYYSGTTTVMLLTPFDVNGTIIPVSCNGGNNGAITISVDGGFPPYGPYIWSNGAATENLTGLTAGTYTVTVHDLNECHAINSFIVTQPAGMTITKIGGSDVFCNGYSTGSIAISVTGGAGGNVYAWSNGGNTATISNLSAGTYTVTVTDINTCPKSASFTVNESNGITIGISGTSPTCYGGSNGTITTTVTGGNSPFVYAWSIGGGSTSSKTGLTAGNYSVTISDATSCSKTATYAVTPTSDIIIAGTPVKVVCQGSSTGSITTSISGGSGGATTYRWNNGQTNATAINLSVGTYTVTVTNLAGCTKSQSFAVTENSAISFGAVATTPAKCYNSNDGSIQLFVSGGLSPYTYLWNNGQTDGTAVNLTAGFYTVTVTDVGPCTKVGSWQVTAPSAMSIKFAQTNVLCNGASTGKIDITVSGGTSPYSYNWNVSVSQGKSTPNISSLSAGTYTVTITDLNTCIKIENAVVTQSPALADNGGPTPVTCYGGNNGTATITGSGGASPYYYKWSTGSTLQLIGGLTAGRYNVTITDANTCTLPTFRDITQPSDITINGTPVKVICTGGNSGSISTTVTGGSGGATYLWNNGQTNSTAINLTVGTYTVTVTNTAGCKKAQSFGVTENSAISFGSVVRIPTKCYNSSDGSIQLLVSGGLSPYTYLWNNGQTNSTAVNLTAGFYTVTVTDVGPCTKVGSWQVTAPSEMSIARSITDLLCNGNPTGKIDITVSGGSSGYSYNWSVIGSQGKLTPHVFNLFSGTYTVTVTDQNTCTKIQSYFVAQPVALSGRGVVTQVTCYGGNDGAATMTGFGGTSPYYYKWSTGSTGQVLTGLTAGRYDVTITDANSCPNYPFHSITQPTDITITGTPVKVICQGSSTGSITTTVSGGSGGATTYRWNNSQTNGTAINLSAGTYTVTVTNLAGCTKSQSFVVTENSPIIFGPVVSIPVKCYNGNDGSIQLFVSGGLSPYTYLWNNGQTNSTAVNLSAGFYTVTVTDVGPCTKVGSWQVTTPSEMSIARSITDLLCNGNPTGKIDITVSGGTSGYSYNWNVIGSQGKLTPHIFNLFSGTYTVTVTDQNTCTKIQSYFVAQPVSLSGRGIVTQVTCYGGNNGEATMTGFGGTSPYYYKWSTGSTGQILTGLTAGRYDVTITDANSCRNYPFHSITQPTDITIIGTSAKVTCQGSSTGSITTTVSGGSGGLLIYKWNNGQTDGTAINLSAGTYTVTVTNPAGCIKSQSFGVTENSAINFGPVAVINGKCYNSNTGSIQLFVSGGLSPYSYLWNNGQTNSTAVNLTAGFYTVTVTDVGDCTKVGSWQVTTPSEMSITSDITNLLCNGNPTGKIDITVSGGTSGYSYNWNVIGSQGKLTPHIFNLFYGTYTVTVTDQNTCTKIQSYVVTQPVSLSGRGVVGHVTCYGGNNGYATMTGFGGTSPYYYKWSTGSTGQVITGLTAGRYDVTITDANSCHNYPFHSITQPSQIIVNVASKTIKCFGFTDGSLSATVSGGITPYNYLWNNGLSTKTITGLSAGIYTVTVTDNQQICPVTASAQIYDKAGWWVKVYGDSTACCNAELPSNYTARLTGDTTNGGACLDQDPTFQWVVVGGTITSGWNTRHITVDWACCTQGTVNVVATRCDLCTVTDTKQVAVHLPPAPVISGPASVYAHTDSTYWTPNFPGHLYTWTVVGGSVSSGQGTNSIVVMWGPSPPCECGSVTVCETDIFGCSECYTMNIIVLPAENQPNLAGTVYYQNLDPAIQIALDSVIIKLRDRTTGIIVATTLSGPNYNPPAFTGEPGYFAFTNVAPGSYTLEASFDGTWGGNNATDALLVQLHIINSPALTGLYKTVADVNASLTITGLDALYIKLRTVGSITSYPAGDWKFDNPDITVTASLLTKNIMGLCVGDVNGSYIASGVKEASLLSVLDDAVQTIPVNQSFTYNINSGTIADLGAMTLMMGYDQNRFDIENVNTSLEGMKYVIDGGKIALAWSDTKPLPVKNDEPIISLTMNAKGLLTEATPIFSLLQGCEFADSKANKYDDFKLKMSKVITPNGLNEFSMFNYPNPFKNTTNIVYTLPESGKVRLVLTNMYGKTVRVLVDEMQNAGSYTVTVNPFDNSLTAGVYLYKIEVNGAKDTYVKVNKMMFTR